VFFITRPELAAYTTSTGALIRIDGQVPELGDLKYKDLNDDGIINDKDRAFSGSYQPKFITGLNFGANWKTLDFSISFYGSFGSKIYNGKKEARFNLKDNIEASEANDRWTFANYTSNVPAASLASLPHSTYFLETGDFVRINNLTIGYTFKQAFFEKHKITNFRCYLTAQNLATFTGYSGFSPELSEGDPLKQGIELNAYPTTRTFAFGVNLTL
jgi:hypothetical protein